MTQNREDPPESPDSDETGLSALEEGPEAFLEQAVQLYLEYRIVKRPPESPPGAARKTIAWFAQANPEAAQGIDALTLQRLHRAFLEAEGDVAQAQAQRRHARRATPRVRSAPASV